MNIEKFVSMVLEEDIGRGDLFSLIGEDREVEANIIAKDNGVLAGEIYAKKACELGNIDIIFFIKDGEKIKKGDLIASLKGGSKKILSFERTILNLLQHASGIATNTNRYVKLLKGYNTKILDTRKTRPLLRIYEKYAVRCGGGVNHRMGIDDCLMIKDTHLMTIKNLKQLIKKAKKVLPFTTKIEVESESFKGAKVAMKSGADIVMCDNMSISEIKRVIKYRNEHYPTILLEASGNINEKSIIEIAKTKIDAISSGSLIHQATWIDFSMKIKENI